MATVEGTRIFYLPIAGEQAIELWRTLRALIHETGHWPVLLGTDEDVAAHAHEPLHGRFEPVHQLIETAQAIDVAGWMKYELDTRYEAEDDFSVEHIRGTWPDNIQPNSQFMIPYDYQTFLPVPQVNIGLIPTVLSWQVPVILRFGAWNYCPKPEEHAAVFRYWEQRYGAELVGMTHDTIEMQVARPPHDRTSALALAYEQFAYCPDIVEQGTTTLAGLAAALLDSNVWFFWWD